MENMKHCQSCGVPIDGVEVKFGTNADGSLSEDYCCYCFGNGVFDDWDGTIKTMEDMINACVPHVVESGAFPDEASARAMLEEMLPQLKRWKTA
ncbi:MAG: zinc ribbon domain-containing protein [Oscillospiraceae bacterium]|nr:zinc ribbon domain-containing protein [Oscillospiraceae bacterium]